MCNFFPALVLRNGDIKWHEATDSHSDLVVHFGLPDDTECRHFAKIEFVPATKDNHPDYANVNGYTLKVDEPTTPAWFEEVRNRVETQCRTIIKSMITDGHVPLMLGGCRILVGTGVIDYVKAGRVVSVSDSGSVGYDKNAKNNPANAGKVS